MGLRAERTKNIEVDLRVTVQNPFHAGRLNNESLFPASNACRKNNDNSFFYFAIQFSSLRIGSECVAIAVVLLIQAPFCPALADAILQYDKPGDLTSGHGRVIHPRTAFLLLLCVPDFIQATGLRRVSTRSRYCAARGYVSGLFCSSPSCRLCISRRLCEPVTRG